MTGGRRFTVTGEVLYVESDDGMMYEVKGAPGREAPSIRARTYRTNRGGERVVYWRKLKPNSRIAAEIANQLDGLRAEAGAWLVAALRRR